MAQGSESDFQLIPSFIISTGSVLNSKNRDLKSFDMQLSLLFILQIGSPTVGSQREMTDLFNIN